jgi:uncharacterized ion transporter superfamily protein YfcC
MSNKENFSSNIDSIIQYNIDLTEKQKEQKNKIELIKEKEINLNKVNSSLKSSNERNSFKRKLIYTLFAGILLVFVLSLSTYIYLVRDFKPDK